MPRRRPPRRKRSPRGSPPSFPTIPPTSARRSPPRSSMRASTPATRRWPTASPRSTARSAPRRSWPGSSSTPTRCAPRCCSAFRSRAPSTRRKWRRASAPTSRRWWPASRAWAGSAPRPRPATKEERAAQAENLRKMLLAMVEDIRVVLIKLAERTQALRSLMSGDAQWRARTAREVLDLFAPLANRLGVWQLKWELEDLSLRALEPATYKSIAKLLDERRLDRERYIEDVVDTLRKELAARRHRGGSHRAPEAHLQHLDARCSASRRASTRSTTSAPCASWSTRSRTATRRSASCIIAGRRSRASSTTTSPSPRPTTTARCTPR